MQELEGFAGAASLHTRADSTLDLLHSASSHFGSRARTQAHPIDCARAISHPKTHTYTLHTRTAYRLLPDSSQTCQCRILV